MANDNDQAPTVEFSEEDFSELTLPGAPKEGETIDWEAEAKKFQGIATRRGTKIQKIKDAQAKKSEVVPPAQDPNKAKELDYGQKAFLISNGIKEPTDQKYVHDAMVSSGKTLEEILAVPFIQAELKRFGEERATKEATPDPDDRRKSPARDTVDYWLAKGQMPPADQPELRRDYVNAKIKAEKAKTQFTDSPVAGKVIVR